MSSKTKEDKRRKWIISLGFSEAEADSFIEFVVPNWKIEALAEVLHKPEPELAPAVVVEPAPTVSEPQAPEIRDTTEPKPTDTPDEPPAPKAEGEGFGDTVPNA